MFKGESGAEEIYFHEDDQGWDGHYFDPNQCHVNQ